MWELCDIVLASAGFCSAGRPGTRELARINEDAKVAPRLPPLMVRWYTNVEADNTICHMAPLPQELLLCNLATDKHVYTFVQTYRHLLPKLIWVTYFSRGMRVIDLYPQKLWVSLVIGILYLSVMPASIMAQLLPMGIPLPIWQLHLFELESVNA